MVGPREQIRFGQFSTLSLRVTIQNWVYGCENFLSSFGNCDGHGMCRGYGTG